MKSEILVLVPSKGDRRLWDLKRQAAEGGLVTALAFPPYLQVESSLTPTYEQLFPLSVTSVILDGNILKAMTTGPGENQNGCFVLASEVETFEVHQLHFKPFTMNKGRLMILKSEVLDGNFTWELKPFRPGRGPL